MANKTKNSRGMLVIGSIGNRLLISRVNAITSHTVDDDIKMAIWINHLAGESGKMPESFSDPPDDFQPEFYSYKEFQQLPGDTSIGEVPSPGIIIAIYNSDLSPEIVSQITKGNDEVINFLKDDDFIQEESLYDIFLSYSSSDYQHAEELQNALTKAGLRCFMADKNLQAGDLWPEEIRRALVNSREMCLLCTPNSIKSEWVLTELGAAWALEKRIVPIIHQLNITNLPDRLNSREAVNFADYMSYVEQARRRLR